jgi:hypothetical protein
MKLERITGYIPTGKQYSKNKITSKKNNLTGNSKMQVNGPTKEAVPAIITASKTVINKKQADNEEKTKNIRENNIKVPKEIIIVSDESVHQPKAAWAWVHLTRKDKS